MSRRLVAALVVLVLLWMPASAHASAAAQVAEAQAQAQMDADGGLWLGLGVLLGVVGWLVAYVVEPTPPASALLGKDPAYVAQYTDTYQQRVKQIRTSKALTGCLIGTAAQAVLWLVIINSSSY